MKLSELYENPKNPSKATEEQLERLAGKLKRVPLGLTAMRIAYVVDENGKKMVISGNKRLRVLKRAYGEDAELPDNYFQDVTAMSEAERHEFIVTANVSDGDWDIEALLEQYDKSELDDFMGADLAAKLLDFKRHNDLAEAKKSENDIPATEEKSASELGKIYQLGKHLLACMDSTSKETIDNLLGDTKVDLVLTDPPYNVNIKGSTKDMLTIMNDSMTNEDFLQFLKPVFKNIEYALKPGGAFYVWLADAGPDAEFELALRDAGLHEQSHLVWVKNTHTFSMGRLDYNKRHEICKYGWKKGAQHYFVPDNTLATLLQDDTPDFTKLNKETLVQLLQNIYDQSSSVVYYNKPTASRLHPTMKPVGLMKKLILNSTRPKETVLDLFLGSGTTLIACEEADRVCVGVEFDPKYCDVIRKRWAEFVHGENCDWQKLTPEKKI